MKIVRKQPAEPEVAPAPEPEPAKPDPAETIAATLERIEAANLRAQADAAMVNKAVAEALASRVSEAPKPTRFEVRITERDAQGRMSAFVIEPK